MAGRVYHTAYEEWADPAKKNTAGPKWREDQYALIEECGVKNIYISSMRRSAVVKASERVAQQLRLYREWKSKTACIEEGDWFQIDIPLLERFIGFRRVITRLKKRGVKLALFPIDLELLRDGVELTAGKMKADIIKSNERFLLENADLVLSHNKHFEAKLREMGVQCRMANLYAFDYLAPDFDIERANALNEGRKGAVIIAGNLNPAKTAYLSELPDNWRFNLYGPNFSGKTGANVCYKGSYTPEDLLHNMEGSYGLVWDGISAETCTGNYGEYLRYNNPLKTSHYLAAGIPVIIWKEAAMADFVLENDCGIVVERIADIASAIEALSDDRYAELKRKAEAVGERIRNGYYMRRLVEDAYGI